MLQKKSKGKRKRGWSQLSAREQSTARKATKAGIVLGESFVATWDTMALPTKSLRRRQEAFIRSEYKRFNRMRRLVHLKPKKYKRLNMDGKLEVIV